MSYNNLNEMPQWMIDHIVTVSCQRIEEIAFEDILGYLDGLEEFYRQMNEDLA